MNKTANYIKNRLSLREPQAQSLEILSILADKITLRKNNNLPELLETVKELYSTCADFERNFPSICFSLATGVGKTRLMGAFIAYLHIEKGINNFFVLAPNLTVYNKLIEDFQNINSPKYVFQGMSEFVHSRPKVITGDNYRELGRMGTLQKTITINVFNISKINAETKGGKEPVIKRLSEYIGQSYFEYLSSLDDLVLLMDESHHYRADRGMAVLNELNPVLGLEVTATPQVEAAGRAIKFKNVVFEYSLAKAIKDGFVKDPAIATRRDFDPSKYSPEDIDRIKIEDGIRIHEETKVNLDIYSRDKKVKPVKPFVLVVAKDTDHASKIKEMIESDTFFEGYYKNKVMEIHSNQRGEEKDENIAKLISLEDPFNKIEIVIHVNMLKEGWDVTNLYTIIPLRTAASLTLREQTIGRGLRLPYGRRTGNPKVDKLTIIAHDKFQEIIDEANKPDSIIRKENIIEIDEQELSQRKEVVSALPAFELKIKEEEKRIEAIEDKVERHKATVTLEAKKEIASVISNEMAKTVSNISQLKTAEAKQEVIKKVTENYTQGQNRLFTSDIVKQVEAVYEAVIEEYIENIIEIPRIVIQPGEIRAGYNDFDIDTKNINYLPTEEKIKIMTLRSGEIEYIDSTGKKHKYDRVENILVSELINFPQIDYDSCSELLFKLVGQIIAKFKTYLNEDQIYNVIETRKKEIAHYIYSQMKEHFYCEVLSYEKPIVRPFSKIEEHNYTKYTKEDLFDYRQTITPTSAIPSKVFKGFKKACHDIYKFDSKTEKDFAIILESDADVLKWMRPAPNQFKIYWDHNSKQYYPDFIVEGKDFIYMIETKKEKDINTDEVQNKAEAALHFCKTASEYTKVNDGKVWKYILIPHNAVLHSMSFSGLVGNYEWLNK